MQGASHPHPWYTALLAGLDLPAEGVVVFEHRGALDHVMVEYLLETVETASLASDDTKPVRKGLINVLLEALENLCRHVHEADRDTSFARLVKTPVRYTLLIGNAVPAATAAVLHQRVDILNEMDNDDLKQHYLGLLVQEGRTANGGAGLGLVTIARKVDRPILVRTIPIDEQKVVFALSLDLVRTPVERVAET